MNGVLRENGTVDERRAAMYIEVLANKTNI